MLKHHWRLKITRRQIFIISNNEQLSLEIKSKDSRGQTTAHMVINVVKSACSIRVPITTHQHLHPTTLRSSAKS